MMRLTRRGRWLRARRRTGQARPRPAIIRVGNADGAISGPRHSTRVFRLLLETAPPRTVAVACVEGPDFRGQAVADQHAPGTWDVVQHGTLGSPESALLLAVRRDRARVLGHTLLPGTPATSEGGGIRARPILSVRIVIDPDTPHEWEPPPIVVGHAHPARAPRARAAFMAALSRVAGIRAGDFNLTARVVARLLGQRVHAAGVLALALPRWIPARHRTVPARRLGGADHPALDTVLWPPKETR